MAERTRTSFGPVLLVGIATAALTAVASSRTWVTAHGDAAGLRVTADGSGSDAAPLALALALVALAAWGVVLVTGTATRRVALALGLLAVLGVGLVLITVDAHDVAARLLAAKGASKVGEDSLQPWYWVTYVASFLQLVAFAAGLRSVASWPTMSSRYDAPGVAADAPAAAATAAGADDLALWKALDEGHDPTAR